MKPNSLRADHRLEVKTYYHFLPLDPTIVPTKKAELQNLATDLNIFGLVILGPEGLNATTSGAPAPHEEFVKKAAGILAEGLEFKNIKTSWVEVGAKAPYYDFVVKIRPEIVTLKRPDIQPQPRDADSHLSPAEWNQHLSNLKSDGRGIIIDTRNIYEWEIGSFENAILPPINEFADFPNWLQTEVQAKKINLEDPAYIFCTGGIRCEKAIRSLEETGFKKIYQLDGGIINYINQIPSKSNQSLWQGDCFVFDHRVAIDGNGATADKYGLCPHCGQPATININCLRCDEPALVCSHCQEKDDWIAKTCSKNCSHHWKTHPGQKGLQQKF